ncbi:MAG: hypothetical protein HY657_09690 [Acidobacteria bacterium]|nr:hypothetical protein [Acidobacteriota bacterium]
MIMAHGHLSDDQLIEICLDRSLGARERQHLDVCPDCVGRRADIAQMLTDVTDTVVAEADAAFPAERLARQQARILHRLAQDGRPGRVIAFPATHAVEPPGPRARPGMRWMAGAAAAGMVIGLLAGHLVHDLPGQAPLAQVVSSRPRPAAGAPALRAVSTTLTEEEFLGQLELATQGSAGRALRPLDDLTPRVWEVSAR